MTVFDSRLSQILKRWVTPTLQGLDFKKRQMNYVKNVDGLSWLINIQRSRWNNNTKSEFTLNCGVYVPGVFSKYANRPERPNPRIEDCSVYARIGMLMPQKSDLWWELRSDDLPSIDENIGRDIEDKLTSSALPFLRTFDQPLAAADFLSNPLSTDRHCIVPPSEAVRFAYAAIIYSQVGDMDRAYPALDMAIRKSHKSPIESVIASLKNRL